MISPKLVLFNSFIFSLQFHQSFSVWPHYITLCWCYPFPVGKPFIRWISDGRVSHVSSPGWCWASTDMDRYRSCGNRDIQQNAANICPVSSRYILILNPLRNNPGNWEAQSLCTHCSTLDGDLQGFGRGRRLINNFPWFDSAGSLVGFLEWSVWLVGDKVEIFHQQQTIIDPAVRKTCFSCNVEVVFIRVSNEGAKHADIKEHYFKIWNGL